MRALIVGAFLLIGVRAMACPGHAHADHHKKHNMVLYGQKEIYASHLVFKVPHNYEVILKLELDADSRELYLRERRLHPTDEFIFLLDEMTIAKIAEAAFVQGTMSRTGADGKKVILKTGVRLERSNFQVVHFSELPTSLEAVPAG